MTAIAEETDAKKKTQLEIELQESENKFRRRKFGNILSVFAYWECNIIFYIFDENRKKSYLFL